MEYRKEHDSMGEVLVPADKLWAAQTQRSHENFEIGVDIETMPREELKKLQGERLCRQVKRMYERKLPHLQITNSNPKK